VLDSERVDAPLAARLDPLVVRPGELERVHLTQGGLPPAAGDPRGGAEIVEQLGHLLGGLLDHPEEAPAPLVEVIALLADRESGVREAAAAALASIGDGRVRPLLERAAVTDPYPWVREAARDALTVLGG